MLAQYNAESASEDEVQDPEEEAVVEAVVGEEVVGEGVRESEVAGVTEGVEVAETHQVDGEVGEVGVVDEEVDSHPSVTDSATASATASVTDSATASVTDSATAAAVDEEEVAEEEEAEGAANEEEAQPSVSALPAVSRRLTDVDAHSSPVATAHAPVSTTTTATTTATDYHSIYGEKHCR
jgi:hypothetical protein